MTESLAGKKKEKEKKISDKEVASQEDAIAKQERESATLAEEQAKIVAKRNKDKEDARKADEKGHSIVVVDVGTYIGKVSPEQARGVDRRLAGIRLMFEEMGVDKYMATVHYKGTEAFVFKK